ncbi:hypothetical protein GGD38_006424 [Chitinophagaceae bacterium OAS944]|nr:hypothetical protein [Chitinophagaceae bacterium OAS944]
MKKAKVVIASLITLSLVGGVLAFKTKLPV